MVNEQRKPNRAERRRMMKEQRHQKLLESPIPLLISCPECGDIDVKKTAPDEFTCNNCGSKHALSEMKVNL